MGKWLRRMVEMVARRWGGWEYDLAVALRRRLEWWRQLVKGLW